MPTTADPQLSVWAYPWDVADRGLDPVIEEIGGLGLNMVSLATSYHAGRFLQPRGLSRKSYFPEDGTVYYRPSPALWADRRIQPKRARQVDEDGDMLRALIDQREKSGIAVSCWTVCLHNTRLGMLHPADVSRNAFGDPSYFALCPSSPEARAYARTLARDISENYRPDRIELETASFMGFTHGYHHEKDGVGLTPEEDFLLSVCFCDHCRAHATTAGIDFATARGWVQSALLAAFERERPERTFPDFPARGIGTFAGVPAFHALLEWRNEVVTSLVAEIRESAHSATKIVAVSDTAPHLAALDPERAAAASDGLILCLYGASAEAVSGIADTRKAIGREKFLGVGLTLAHPAVAGPEELAEITRTAVDAGADGLNYYNYGLVPARRLAWIGHATRALRG